MAGVQHYLHPITYEANIFAKTLEELGKNYSVLDPELIESLENVMQIIDSFLDKAKTEIVPTQHTKLIKADAFKHICRTYRCTLCRKDLGKTGNCVPLHLTQDCKFTVGIAKNPIATEEERRRKRKEKKNSRLQQAVVLRKKAKCFLSSTLHAALTMLGEAAIVGDKLKCLPAYNDIENDLLGLIKPLFPNQSIKVYKFGSRICGVGSRDSDLDLFVDIGDTFKIYENRASKETLAKMQVVQKALKNHPKTWKCLVAVDKARVPILKIIHAPTSIECDINFSNSLGYVNTLLLEYIFSLQPVARLMCIYIKKWKHHIGFDKEISTYSMNLMVIFYLQTLDILPPFEKLFRNVDVENSLQVGPWLGSYQQLTLNDLNIKLVDFNKARTYVEEFFVYFSAFEYENMVVCPYFGVGIKKEKFDMLMPNRYTSYIKDNPDFGVEFKKPMIVQDPFQLNRNVTNGVTEFHLKVIKEFMAKSADIIAQTRN
ncbi:terminal uridylyltransferase Tailor [Stomoxys calcitrans]|uniref:terminal uridylyltransferase Tailor n=1 Tax=Stomoxys calcitrans TaxID=35570 RepID=UPI0027E38F60|nr:terminal uridylyltransferase Tailor [Stomoxys calcitrans]